MKTITIAGNGFVGNAHAQVLRPYFNINIVDPKMNFKKVSDYKTDALIICVSTPESNDGSCYMQNVYDVLDDTDPSIPVLIKSTISLEGWENIEWKYPDHSITFCPEYLRAQTALEDFQNTEELHLSNNSKYGVWMDIFRKPFPTIRYSLSTPKALILNKYCRNSFLALKVSFFNQIYDLCTEYGIDYKDLINLLSKDERIGNSHMKVTGERGFGGHCFPKDTAALEFSAHMKGVDLSILTEAIEYNKRIRDE